MSTLTLHIFICLFSLWQSDQLPDEGFSANHCTDCYFDFVFDSISDSTSPVDLNDKKKHKAVYPVYKDSHVCYLQHVPLCIYFAASPTLSCSILFESDTSPPISLYIS